MDKLETQHEKIVQFYQDHPRLNFEEMNLLLINLLENVMKMNSDTDTSYIFDQVMSKLNHMNEDSLRYNGLVVQEIDFIKSSLSQNNDSLKILSDVQQNFLSGVRDIFENKELKTLQEISGYFDKHVDIFSNKMKAELLPKLDNNTQTIMAKSISLYKEEIKEILKSNRKEKSLDDLQLSIVEKHNALLNDLSGKLNGCEMRITENLSKQGETLRETKQLQLKLDGEWDDYMRKQKNSSIKGAQSENRVNDILNRLFPSAEIFNTASIEKSGDFIISREDRPHILVENKDYGMNVPKKEVEKFVRDVTFHKCHGLFLSQSTGITCKENFQIEVYDNNILLYLHNVNYRETYIKLAIDVIDQFGERLVELSGLENNLISIPKEVLSAINEEYNDHLRNKENVLSLVKEYSKKLEDGVKKIQLPSLERYLSTKFASVNNSEYKCDICNDYNAKNLRALAAHKKACSKRNIVDNTCNVVK